MLVNINAKQYLCHTSNNGAKKLSDYDTNNLQNRHPQKRKR